MLVPVALMAAIGFVAETRGAVIGGKSIVAAGYAAAKDELEEMERRRARIASTRTPEQVGAAIEATRREPVRQGTRLRGTVEDISANCNRTDALTVEACRRITGLRQELADVEAGDRLDRQIGELRAKLEALRSQGGMQDTNVAASAVHHLVGRWVSLAQVLAGQNLLLPLAFEFWAMFGLVVVLDRRRRERPVVMVDDSAQTDAPAGAATEQTEMVATGRGAVAEFVRNGLEASEDSVMRRVELVDGYARWCAARRQVPVARAQFWEHFAGAGPAAGLKWSRRNGELVLSGVQLRSP